MKTNKGDIQVQEIRKQFAELEKINDKFSQKIEELKQEQLSFNKYMRVMSLLH